MVAGEHEPPRPYRPHDGVTLVGPFWTRRQVAAHLGITIGEVRRQPILLRVVGALSVEEVYPSLQFDESGVRREVGFLARLLKRRVTDVEACDWLLRPRRRLDNRSPIAWLAADGDVDRVVRSLPAPSRPVPGGVSLPGDVDEWKTAASPTRSPTAPWSSQPVAH